MGDTQKAQFSPLTGTAALLASKFLSCEQVAAILHVHVGTLRRWRHLAQGPPFARVGRQVVYHADALDDFIKLQGATRRGKGGAR